MPEHLLGYLDNLTVAERLGRALADAALADERDSTADRQRLARQRKRRERVARVLRALATRLAPVDAEPTAPRRALSVGNAQ